MKAFSQLTDVQQKAAVDKCLVQLLESILKGAIRFSDEKNGDDLQSRIDAAWEKAEKMQTPWFAHEFILDTCREDLEGMATCDAEDALYSSQDERVVTGIA